MAKVADIVAIRKIVARRASKKFDNFFGLESLERDYINPAIAEALDEIIAEVPDREWPVTFWDLTEDGAAYRCRHCGMVRKHIEKYCPNCGFKTAEDKE